ncbi:hypothetical protein LHGZ1_1819 [Laribacter hongkongensis]|uniref:Uncharacterized protein n=1 Tax=Laribacter hongkongensis TaxID=168471 RepID=A0A248LIN0_9NEIS|nr:hypothetical protein LHGZ1_1819 [Laribacter hongkongensis]
MVAGSHGGKSTIVMEPESWHARCLIRTQVSTGLTGRPATGCTDRGIRSPARSWVLADDHHDRLASIFLSACLLIPECICICTAGISTMPGFAAS